MGAIQSSGACLWIYLLLHSRSPQLLRLFAIFEFPLDLSDFLCNISGGRIRKNFSKPIYIGSPPEFLPKNSSSGLSYISRFLFTADLYMDGGRVKIHRKFLDWGRYSDGNTARVFLHLLLTANHKENVFLGQTIKVGDSVIGLLSLSEKLGMSIRSVRTALEHLKTTNEITIKTTNKFSIITLVRRADYQYEETKTTNKTTKKTTNDRQTTDKPTTTLEEGKNVRMKEKNNNTNVLLASPEFGDQSINTILEKIKMYNGGIIDGTQTDQRKYGKLLLNKLEKLDSVSSGKYTAPDILEIILKIISKSDYHSQKIAGPKKIYYELAGLMQICKQDMQRQEKSKIPHIPGV